MAFERLTMENYTYTDSEFMETGIAQAFNLLAAYEDLGSVEELAEMKSFCEKTYDDLRHRLRTTMNELEKLKQQIAKGELVKAVRCKDCIDSINQEKIKNSIGCLRHQVYMPLDGYCSKGERRCE